MAIFWGWPNGGFEPKIKAVVDLAEKRDYGGCDKYPFFRDFINSGFGIGALYVSKAVYSCLWRATTILWRQYVANRFPLFNFINLYQKMSGHSAHFSFDTFRGYSLKGVFLSSFLTAIIEDKPFHFGATWPEVRPRCRSPPLSISIRQPPKIEMEERPMAKINLRDFYPFYNTDLFIEIQSKILFQQ